MRSIARAGIIAGLLAALTGCATGITPIGNLLNNPAHYNGKTVEIEGEVLDAVGGFGVGGFQVRDKTGVIPVVTTSSPPTSGSKIGVKGKFQPVFTIGTRSIAVLQEESRSTK